MTALPCATRLDVYDALFDDEDPAVRAAALPVAVGLCASCPSPCSEKVTPASQPRRSAVVVLDDEDVTGPARLSRAPSRIAAWCRANPVPWQSEAYIPPAKRAEQHALEAAHYARLGYSTAEIAERLCVPVSTVPMLLRLAGTVRELRAAA